MEDRLAPGSMLSLAGAFGGPLLELLAASRLTDPLPDGWLGAAPAISATASPGSGLLGDLRAVAVVPQTAAASEITQTHSSGTSSSAGPKSSTDSVPLSGPDFAAFGSQPGSAADGAFSFGSPGMPAVYYAGGGATSTSPPTTGSAASMQTPALPGSHSHLPIVNTTPGTRTSPTSNLTNPGQSPNTPPPANMPPSGGGGSGGPLSGTAVGRLRTIVPPAPSSVLTHTGYIGSQTLMNLLYSYRPNPNGSPTVFTPAQQMTFVLKSAPYGMDSVLVNTRWLPGTDLMGTGATLQQQLSATVTTVTQGQSLITAWLPIRNLTRITSIPGFASIVPVYHPIEMSGSVMTQGDQVMGSDGFRNTVTTSTVAAGLNSPGTGGDFATGKGVTVGILSDSINQINSNVDPTNHDIGIKESQDTGDLPAAGVQVLADGSSTDTDEGRGMAEVIYDVAPGASLAFNTSDGGPQAMARGITNLATQAGAEVIVDDTQYPDEPFFNNGVIAQAVNNVARQNNVVYVTAAGNEGNAGWQAAWNPITQTIPGQGGGTGSAQVFAVVNGTPITQQKFNLSVGQTLNLVLQWDSPFLEGGTDQPAFQVQTQINASIINTDSGAVVANFNDDTLNTDEAMQRVVFTNQGQYNTTHFAMMFWLAAGPAPTQLRWVRFDNNPAAKYQGASTVFGHAAAATALTVGAVPWNNPTAPEGFSSQGPTMLLGGDQGVHLTTPITNTMKPDVFGPDQVNTAHFPAVPAGQTLPPGTHPVFTGTSAAAAHVAAVAALLRSVDASANYSQVVDQMQQGSQPVGAGSPVGLIHAHTSGLGVPVVANTSPLQTSPATAATHLTENVTGEAIAVNPTNPSMMVVAANPVNDLESGVPGLVLSVSLDGGKTWQDRLAANGHDGMPLSGGEPTVAFDAYGNLFLAYLDFSGAQIDVLYSTDGGTTFQTAGAFAGDDQPTLATVKGAVWLSYNNGSLQAAGAPVTGLGKIGSFTVETVPNSTNGNFGSIAIGPRGQVMVAYQSDASAAGPDSIMVSVDSDGFGPGSFSSPTVATTTQIGGFTPIPATGNRTIDAGAGLAWDQNASGSMHPGRVYLVYTDSPAVGSAATTIYERYSDNGGTTWSARVKVNSDTSGRSHFWPQIAVDQTTGNVGVSWLDARNDTGKGMPNDRDGRANTDVEEYAAVSMDGGKVFSQNLQVSAAPSNAAGVGNNDGLDFGDRTGLAFDHGNLMPAWPDNSGTLAPGSNGAGNMPGAFQGGSGGTGTNDIGMFAVGTARIFVPRVTVDDPYEPNDTSDKAVALGVLNGGTVAGGAGGLGAGFPGMNNNDNLPNGFTPPDTTLGVGPTAVVEALNAIVAIYDKSGNPLLGPEPAATFFAPLGPFSSSEELTDPIVSYDTISQRFIVGMLGVTFDSSGNISGSRMLVAESKDSNPLDGFSVMKSINTLETDQAGNTLWSDYPTLGWNADEIVISLNMFPTGSAGTVHVQLLTIDANNPTFTVFKVDRSKPEDFTLAPASMYGAAPGSPMWLVEENGMGNGSAIRVVEMTNGLSNSPTFTDTVIPVSPYTFPVNTSDGWIVTDPGGLDVNADDPRIQNAVWNNGILVADHNVGLASTGSDAKAAWYQLDTTGAAPTLTDQGVIDPGTGINTLFPAISVKSDGTIGMTFMESSASEPMSMYVTGRTPSDAPGTMESPSLAIEGDGPYSQPQISGRVRAGDHAGIGIDPTDGSFWAANEYDYAPATVATWGTFIQQFSIAGLTGSNVITGVNIDVHSNGLPDYDWYRWTAGGTGTVTVVVSEVGNLEVHLFTLNSLGTLIQLGVASSKNGVGTLTVKGSVAQGAPVLVEVKGVNMAAGVHGVGTYSLSIGLQ